jgi:hypothetical protein
MNNTKKPASPKRRDPLIAWLVMAVIGCYPLWAHAEIKLSSDWNEAYTCTGSPRTNAEMAEMQQGLRPRPVCTKTEYDKLVEASAQSAITRSAALDRTGENPRGFGHASGFKLQLNGQLHYLKPMRFMTKSRPNEVCTPSDYRSQPTYRCNEGQRYIMDCHLFVYNERYEEVGYHRIGVNEPYQFYCNAVPAIGVADSANNLLLATVQYFPIDRKHASKISEVGSGWSRMTVALRLKPQEDGRVLIEQEDRCLGNPNRIETIPDARRKLKKCLPRR